MLLAVGASASFTTLPLQFSLLISIIIYVTHF